MAVWSVANIAGMTRWDPEHHRPEFVRQSAAIARRRTRRLGDVAAVSDGNHLGIADEFADDGVRYLRGQDLSEFFISDGDPIYIPPATYEALARSHMRPGDVLVSVVGTIGSVGLVTDRHGRLTGSCKLAIVRCDTLSGEYVAAYLASAVGQNEIHRRVRGAVQMGLILPDLRDLPIVIPTEAELKSVVNCVVAARAARDRAAASVAETNSLFAKAVALGAIDLSPSRSYVRKLSEMFKAKRFGAEFFMPCKARAIEAIRAMPHRPLSHYVEHVRDMWSPSSAVPSEVVRNFDVGDAAQMVMGNDHPTTEAGELGSDKKQFRNGDVVISRLRSYLRQIAAVRCADDVPCVGSSELVVLRPKAGSEISPESLVVYLRSDVIQTILKWSQDGTAHPRFDEAELLELPVPDKLLASQDALGGLVARAVDARREMLGAVDRAKGIVESAVFGERAPSNGRT